MTAPRLVDMPDRFALHLFAYFAKRSAVLLRKRNEVSYEMGPSILMRPARRRVRKVDGGEQMLRREGEAAGHAAISVPSAARSSPR